jgi:CRP/FNR family cyclic AMP-dependent transcriptional regulator
VEDAKAHDWPIVSFLAGLSARQRADLLGRGVQRRYERGRTLLDQGTAGRAVLILCDGVVKISALSADGHESVLGLRTRGDLIGEMAFVTGAPRSARVVAATPTDARMLTESEFTAYLAAWPAAASEVTAAVVRKLRKANERRAEFLTCSAAARVAVILSETALALGHPVAGGLSIGSEITQADLASLAAVSLSTLEKVLQTLERSGLVERRRRALVITDPTRLRRQA